MAKQSQPETEQSISVRRYSIQLQPNPAALPTSETTTTGDEDTREPSLDAERIGHKFQTILQMLWKYMHGIGAAAEATTSTNLAAFVALIKDISDRKRHANTQDIPLATLKWECEGEDQSTNERKTLRLTEPVYDRRHLDKILKFQQCHDIALRILNETAIQQMVNSWEQLLADLYEWQLLSNPLVAPKDHTLTYTEILSYSSLDQVKRAVLNQEIEAFLKHKTAEEQISHFNKAFGIDLSSHFPPLNELKEIILRRHVIVHAGGVATSEYARRVKRIRGISLDNVVEGQQIPIHAGYVKRAWNTVHAAGIVLLHLVAQSHARASKNKDMEDAADSFLNTCALSSIVNGQYEAAEWILTYAHKIRLRTETINLMVRVNLAQTMKWTGRREESKRILDDYDWSSSSTRFQLCVAALREEYDRFKSLLPTVASQNEIKVTELYEWPVFRSIRTQKSFDHLIEEVFGVTEPGILSALEPKVIDLRPEDTFNALKSYLEQVLDSDEIVGKESEQPEEVHAKPSKHRRGHRKRRR